MMEHKTEMMSDEELIQLLKADESDLEKVFTEFYNRYSSNIYAFCRRFLNNSSSAQDIYQETFIRFHNSLNRKPISNVLGYLLTIARNLCLNEIRRVSVRVEYNDYHSIKYDNRTERDELLDLIKSSIELIPEDYREIFIFREYEGMSYAEIAEITQMNINTVKVKLFRARKMLREILEPYMADYDFGKNM